MPFETIRITTAIVRFRSYSNTCLLKKIFITVLIPQISIQGEFQYRDFCYLMFFGASMHLNSKNLYTNRTEIEAAYYMLMSLPM